MKIKLNVENLPSYMNDVPEIIRAFFPFVMVCDDGDDFEVKVVEKTNTIEVFIISEIFGSESASFNLSFEIGSLEYKRVAKREVKKFLYRYISNRIEVTLPYGSLTGVRPTRIYYDLIGSHSNPIEQIINEFYVEESRAKLIEDVVNGQRDCYFSEENEVDIFVNIPICPTRCKYCSFISTEFNRVKNWFLFTSIAWLMKLMK